jgi:hypothetical protein
MKNLFLYAVLLCLLATSALLRADALDEEGVNARAVHAQNITGQGVRIALISQGNVRAGHAAFQDTGGKPAVGNHDFTGQGLSRNTHDTNMAGLMVSRGSPTHPEAVGVAPGAQVHSARIVNSGIKGEHIVNALETLITKHHCRVVVTGIQFPHEGVRPDGSSFWSKLYDYFAENYDVVFINAAGNSSPTVTVFGDASNGLTTAGLKKDSAGVYRQVGRISNSGPTADGRKKPDVAAPSQAAWTASSAGDDLWMAVDPNGLGLTSFSAPFTAGTAALLLEFAARSKTENDDRSEVIKAVIVNSVTTDLLNKKGAPVRPDGAVSAWDADSGYGRINALKAYQTLAAGPLVRDQQNDKQLGWAYGVMQKNDEHVYPVQIEKGRRLVLTATWNRKLTKAGSLFLDEPTPFKLDVKVIDPAGRTVVFETAGANNLVKTDCVADTTGTYKIVLRNATSADNRDYGLAFEIF